MTELVEAGTHGLLGEDLLMKALQVNDAIIKTLEAEVSGTKLSPDDLGLLTSTGKVSTGDLLDFDHGSSSSGPSSSSSSSSIAGYPTASFGKVAATAMDDDDEFSSLTTKTVRKATVPPIKSKINPLPPPPGSFKPAATSPAAALMAQTAPVAPLAPPLDFAAELDNMLGLPPGGVVPVDNTNSKMTDKDLDDFLNGFDSK